MNKNILVGIFGKRGGNLNNFTAVCSSNIKEFMRSSYDFLWKQAIKYYAKTKELFTWPIFKGIVQKSIKLTSEVKLLYLTETKQLFDFKNYRHVVNNRLVRYSIIELNTIHRQLYFAEIVRDHFAKAKAGDVEDLDVLQEQTIHKLMASLVSKQQPDYKIVHYDKEFIERQEIRRKEKEEPDNIKKFYFKYKQLNKIFNKGYRGGDVVIISGITGVGKSIMAGDVSTSAAEQHLNVLYITSENSIHQTCGRLDSNITGYEYDMIQAYGFDREKDVRKCSNFLSAKTSVFR